MFTHRRFLGLILALFLGGVSSWALSAPGETVRPSPEANARVEAARKVYETTVANGSPCRCDPCAQEEKIYLWSRRWMEAQRDLSDRPLDQVGSVTAHVARMRQREEMVKRLHQTRAASGLELAAVEYYRAEAEAWLAQAKAK